MEVKDIKRIALGEDEWLWVTLPESTSTLPSHVIEKHLLETQEQLSMIFLTNRILVTPAGYDIKSVSFKQKDDHNE